MNTKLLFLLFSQIFLTVSSEKILFLFPLATRSETHVFNTLARGLAARDHDVTIITPVPSKTFLPPNIKEISPLYVDNIMESFGNIFTRRKMGTFASMMSFDLKIFTTHAETVYVDSKFQEAISQEYDLVFISVILNEAFVGVLDKIGAPSIIITSMPTPSYLTRLTGNHLPPSFVPVPFFDFSDRMEFLDRVKNFFLDNMMVLNRKLTVDKMFETTYRKHLGQEMGSMETILRNSSLIFMNSHFSLNYPRPNLPDNIEIGGIHCRPAKVLPKDLDKFVTDAKDGVIYFSLGSVVQATDMPEESRRVFVNVFGRMKEKILWKWETEEMSDLPPNVKLSKWLPQQDILGHPNVKLFITHGGLLSTQEAAYHGVPLLGLPLFFDQDLNTLRAAGQGFALFQEILNITENELERNLRTLLDEPGFRVRAKELSRIVKDQLDTPLERAVYWSEYVMRHKGALHLRSAARNLNFARIHSLDVIGFLAMILAAILWFFVFCCKCIWKCFGKSKKIRLSEKKSN